MKQKSKKEIDEGILNYDYGFENENQDFDFWYRIDIEDELDLDSGEIEHNNYWDDWE